MNMKVTFGESEMVKIHNKNYTNLYFHNIVLKNVTREINFLHPEFVSRNRLFDNAE
jgi:hypothetical protein